MYLALYRKYRPRTFDDVISQPHIVTTLKNQIATGQNAHAYLFTGSRGTGKTTCSKILAMALNCQHPVNGNPCLECQSCREIAEGESTDILEIDAASNSSVNDVHDLQEQLAYTPVSCKYRVYILDEVHMLSKAAFNALLKTIEEPPPHVIFIFATTELHKVPATILSRCQRFEFRRIDIADSSARLMSVAENEGITLAREAADMISRLSDGGMRDALSLLDRCIAVSRDVTADVVRNCAGVADNHHLFQFADMIANGDIPGCITLLEQLYKGGKDISRVMEELCGVFRDIMLCRSAPSEKSLLSVMPSDYEEIERLSGLFSMEEILRCLTLIQECTDKISSSRSRRTMAEMCFVKLCTGAPTAAQSAAAPSERRKPAPASKPAEYKPMGSEFTPLPDEKLNPKAAQNVNKLRQIFSEPEEKKPDTPVKEPEAQPRQTVVGTPRTDRPKTASAPEFKPETAANISKIQETASQFPQAEPAGKTETPAAAAQTFEPPLPELNSKPAAPEAEDFVPPPEEPPEEFVPQREFELPISQPNTISGQKREKSAQTDQETPTAGEPAAGKSEIITEAAGKNEIQSAAAEEKAPAVVSEQIRDNYARLTGITEEEWSAVIGRVSPLYASMLEGSEVSVNESGALEIRSGNIMLQGMTASGTQELEKELEAGFGKKVHAAVISTGQEETAGDESSAVKELLERAKRLNIEVQYK